MDIPENEEEWKEMIDNLNAFDICLKALSQMFAIQAKPQSK